MFLGSQLSYFTKICNEICKMKLCKSQSWHINIFIHQSPFIFSSAHHLNLITNMLMHRKLQSQRNTKSSCSYNLHPCLYCILIIICSHDSRQCFKYKCCYKEDIYPKTCMFHHIFNPPAQKIYTRVRQPPVVAPLQWLWPKIICKRITTIFYTLIFTYHCCRAKVILTFSSCKNV